MSVSININGTLLLDQTSGLQADDVDVSVVGGDLSGGLDQDFLDFLNGLGLSDAQEAFAADVEGASDSDFVSVTADAGETVGKLFFSDASGNDFNGDAAIFNGNPITTIGGDALFLYSEQNGKVVLLKTAGGDIAAAFYIEGGPDNLTATVQAVTFIALAHPNPNDPNDVIDFADVLSVSAVISKPAPIGVIDDAPTVVTSGQEDSLAVDETDLGTDASGSFAAAFDPDFGTDGAGSLVYALGISAPDADSGLVDTDTGDAILLRIDADGNVEGYLANDPSTIAFEITLDENNADVTLNQLRAVVHPNAADPDDDTTLAADDLITVTATITDADGDQDEASINVGQNFVFGDDGPFINTTGAAPDLTVDETDLTTNASGSVAAAFTSDGGADGTDTVGYALNLGTNPDGTDSGLVDTATGDAILLRVANGDVEGYLENDPATVAFRVSLNELTGAIGLDQLRAVVHPNDTDPDDDVKLTGTDLIVVTATITDGDGDQDSSDLDVTQALTFGDDGPFINTTGTEDNVVVDETDLTIDGTGDFSTAFTHGFGADGDGGAGVDYILDAVAGASGLLDTATGESVILSKEGNNIVGRITTGNALVFTVSVSALGVVTVDQARAVVHADPDTQNEFVDLQDDLITLTASVVDGDGDDDSETIGIGKNIQFYDDAPSITVDGTPPDVIVDESDFTTDDTQSFAGNFVGVEGNDLGGSSGISYALDITDTSAGLIDTVNGEAVSLAVVAGVIEARNVSGDLMFTISVDVNGNVTLDQSRAVGHPDDADPNDVVQMATNELVTLTATITDGDGDHDSASLDIGKSFAFLDDGPEITVPSSAPDAANAAELGNQIGESVVGEFGYDLGADGHNAAFYTGGGSDFVNGVSLTGVVDNDQNPGITNVSVVAGVEDEDSATFNFSFQYDKDPITAGIQSGTAGGTLTFDKDADTFEVTMTDPIDGFSFSVLHTNELLAKAPPGNTGHPEIVATQLTPNGDPNPFFVQFTANTTTQQIGFITNANGADNQTGNTAWVAGEFVANSHIDWVSATQSTNGVAGDTIQKGELLNLRFFEENILSDVVPGAPGGGTERLDPTTTADGIAIKFDGIGNAEDLVVILNLIDANGVETTRAVNVQNSDLIKGNANIPFPYNTEFSLDNNDALLIMESNDYNALGETFQIQGVQIMQSANGLTGQAINLNGATGVNGGSNATGGLQVFDPTDNDVLKITDIGFIQTQAGTIDANLDFSFALNDADFDPTATQHIFVNVSNDFIV